MKLEIHGRHERYSAHGEHDGGPAAGGTDISLKPCPFCCSTDVTVENTHTPYYTGECRSCGARGPSSETGRHIPRRCSRAAVTSIHQAAFDEAVKRWNCRVVVDDDAA